MKQPNANQSVYRRAFLTLAIPPLLIPLVNCGGHKALTGTFIDSAVSGLDFVGTTTPAGVTDALGQFTYSKDETIRFAIGNLQLGSAQGAEIVTPLLITSGAASASEPSVNNKLILLQSLDADGDLNNGIQITETIRSEVSASAASINFDQPVADFRSSLQPLLAVLEGNGAFSDSDPRPRAVRDAADAVEHFTHSTSPRTVVSTTGGDLRGFEANENTWQFLGVPYARPPLGDLRWRPPQLPEPWSGVRDAVAWADQSAQNPTLETVGEGGMSEDSLYLNITTPKDAEGLPVMVWFHGGSFAILSANSKQYNNPDSLTGKGVVLVTVNHRLGPFGYIAHPLLSAESGYNGSGNYGQMDLVMALQWIQNNIAAFGGNPANVTIFGQSGGGGKSYSLMNSPLASGLFHKAIVQSGALALDTTSAPDASLATSEAIGSALFDRIGVTTLEQARALPWTALVQADLDNNIPRQTYQPNVDYYYQTHSYYQNVMLGMPSDVPLMSGVTSGDYDSLREALPIWLTQRSPTYQSPQYVYKFSRVPDGWGTMGLNSCHGCELPYVFNYPAGMVQNYALGLVLTPQGEKPDIGDLNGNGVSGTDGDTADIFASMQWGATDFAMTEQVMNMWTNFAKTGNPGTQDFSWPAYTVDNDSFVEIGPQAQASVKTGLDTALNTEME